MANLTLKIPDEELKRARIRAIEEGTSVNEVVRKWIKEYGEREDRIRAAMDRVLAASRRGLRRGPVAPSVLLDVRGAGSLARSGMQ